MTTEVKAVGGTLPAREQQQPKSKTFSFQEKCLNILKMLGLVLSSLCKLVCTPSNYKNIYLRLKVQILFLNTAYEPSKEKLIGNDGEQLYQPFSETRTEKKALSTTNGETITVCDEFHTDAARAHFTINNKHAKAGELDVLIPKLKSQLSDEEILHLSPSLEQRTRLSVKACLQVKHGIMLGATPKDSFPDIQIYVEKDRIIVLSHCVGRTIDENDPTISLGYIGASSIIILDREKLKKGANDAATTESVIYHGFIPYRHEQKENTRPPADGIIANEFMKKATEAKYLADLGLGQVLRP